MPADIIPSVPIPRYFTMLVVPNGTGTNAHIDAEIPAAPPTTEARSFHKQMTYNKSPLVLDDILVLFEVDREKLPLLAKIALSTIALPPNFELSAQKNDNPHIVDLRLRVTSANGKHHQWHHAVDTAEMKLTDLAVLLVWVKEAKKYQR